MMRKAWAIAALALLIIACFVWVALHWQSRETVSYIEASVKPKATAVPYPWPGGAVNVNTAGVQEMQTLQGINRSQIEALLADRTQKGHYDFPQDIIYVKGIGEKTLAKIWDQLNFSWRTN